MEVVATAAAAAMLSARALRVRAPRFSLLAVAAVLVATSVAIRVTRGALITWQARTASMPPREAMTTGLRRRAGAPIPQHTATTTVQQMGVARRPI